MEVAFCGVRGSTPAPGVRFARYGGQTSCVALAPDGGDWSLVLDAGTGLITLGDLLDGAPFRGTVLLSHLHWDHTHGMPFFGPGFDPASSIEVLVPAQGDPVEVLARAFSPPHFPITPPELGDCWSFGSVDEGWQQHQGFRVLAREVPHKGGRTFGYRVEQGGASLAYFSDHSPTSLGPGPDGLGERHAAAVELCAGADVLITDAQHLQAQFPGVQFLGHASVEYDVELAREAGVRTLVLFHHAPTRTDDEIDEIAAYAQDLAGSDLDVVAASEGLQLQVSQRRQALRTRRPG